MKYLLIIAAVLGLVFLEPDYGTTLLLAAVSCMMLIIAGTRQLPRELRTAVIHRLEAAGHVQRLRSRTDARSTHLQVSDTAVALGWQFFGPLLDRLITATQTLDPSRQAVVKDYLTAVSDALA